MDIQIKLSLDGNLWCLLIGEDLMEGVAGFGATPEAAIADLLAELEKLKNKDLTRYAKTAAADIDDENPWE